MTSPLLGMKTKKSPCLPDSHHLFEAVTKGKIHLTRFILAAANSQLQNSWDKEGRTPLIACCDIKEEGTRDQIVQILLECGADVNMTDREGRSPLIHACEKRCNDIVRILIHHHNIKPDLEDVYGNTALIYSAAVGNDVATELLTRNFRRLGLHVDHYNKQGNTALLVATKNDNTNCAKILTQKGRANVYLKDRENDLTPLELCLSQGYSKEEVDFLRPNSRFYRVAKLATSLSRSRSSVTSLNPSSDATLTSTVTPSKSMDSDIVGSSGNSSRSRSGNDATTATTTTTNATTTKVHGKVTLSRSKSQSVETTDRIPTGGDKHGIFRQSTVDVPTPSNRRLASAENTSRVSDISSSLASGMKIKDWKPRKDDSKDKGKSLKKLESPRDGLHVSSFVQQHEASRGKVDSNLEECMSVSSVKISRKGHTPDAAALGCSGGRANQHETATNRSGQLTGLGCTLSISSIASSATSVGSSSDSDRPESEQDGMFLTSDTAAYITTDHVSYNAINLAKSYASLAVHPEEGTGDDSSPVASACSGVGVLPELQQATGTATSAASNPNGGGGRGGGGGRRQRNSGDFGSTSFNHSDNNGQNGANCPRGAGDEAASPESASPRVPDGPLNARVDVPPDETELSPSSPLSHRIAPARSVTSQQDNDGITVTRMDSDEQYTDAGHNVLSCVKSPGEFTLQNPPAGHDSRICKQISQDA